MNLLKTIILIRIFQMIIVVKLKKTQILGGYSGNNYGTRHDVLDLKSRTWHEMPPLPRTCDASGAAVSDKGQIWHVFLIGSLILGEIFMPSLY